MPEKILLIQPRWMTQAMAQQKIKLWRKKFPCAQMTLLAGVPLEQPEQEESNFTCWLLPPLQKGAMMRFARHLRRTRFQYAVVLCDNARGDVGYGEAKFWAFVARARRREFDGNLLTLLREARAKRKVALVFSVHVAVMLCQLLKVPRRAASVVPPELLKCARTFVYLQHARHQHGLEPGRVFFDGANWDEATARRCGWPVVKQKNEALLWLVEGLCDDKISPGSANKLICISGVSRFSQWDSQLVPVLREIEKKASFFEEEACDIWLVAKR